MQLTRPTLWAGQCVLAGLAILLAVWAAAGWFSVMGIALIGAGALGHQFAAAWARGQAIAWRVALAGLVLLAPDLVHRPVTFWATDVYFAFVPWLLAVAVLLPEAGGRRPEERMRWRVLALLLAFGGDIPLLAAAYLENNAAAFLTGLLLASGLLILVKLWLPMRGWAIQTVNTLILLVIGLPVADFLISPAEHLGQVPQLSERPWSYEFAKRDRAGYARWWAYYMSEGPGLYRAIFSPDPAGLVAWHLKPNSRARFCESQVSVNGLGFRGRETTVAKGNKFRIIALGESTTWGATLGPEDRPWPVALEEFIAQRLHPTRPVEVINAGVPSINLQENVNRLETQILPLKPDLIISYHGYNGFPWLDAALPPVRATRPPPKYKPRPLKLLADCEYAWRAHRYRRGVGAARDSAPGAPMDPMATEFATQYRRLIEITRTNGIRLVLATYSMAANAQSGPGVTGFYQHIIPSLARQVKACEVHHGLVMELARQHPKVILVDTWPRMNGQHEYYIDLMHFTQSGRERMAEMFLAAVKPVLAADGLLATNSTPAQIPASHQPTWQPNR